ncbi:hypothetical protein MTP10_33280 [Nonomuraea sp. 3-1Str]|uniref:hypothetical protein n=1 Tax=Nonomuraea sp. 3-1Str TaxID=2929801 RepID=UPI0028588999|nr:hypothetical protein [Nonomuraea sp. 3-1Str]MDR8413597.1 hypothetical protein [Nonomuraea sp. 3-1Str]
MRPTRTAFALAATASSLALLTAAPAVAAPAARTQVTAPASTAQASTALASTALASWHTQRHETLGPYKGYFDTSAWTRPSGVRVMQVKARCWGNDARIKVDLWFLRRWGGGEKIAKSGTWSCNGKYGIVRISNAGHSKYWATFNISKKHTVEYWVQYYK